MKVMIVGHARHGKDTVAHMICAIRGLDFVTSSHFCAEHVVRPWLAERGVHYPTVNDCYQARANHRVEWFNAIAEFNKVNGTRLTRAIFSRYDMYCGIRNRLELEAVRKACDLADVKTVWVDASLRKEHEPETSITVTEDQCDYFIPNNTNLDDLWFHVKRCNEEYLSK